MDVFSESSSIQLRYLRKMICGYCLILPGCIDVLGVQQKSAGMLAALLSWLEEARRASMGFSSVCLLLTLTRCPPLLLCPISLVCLSPQTGENKVGNFGLKGCKGLLIPRFLAFLGVGVRKGVCLRTDMSMQVRNGALAPASNRMHVTVLIEWICVFCSWPSIPVIRTDS